MEKNNTDFIMIFLSMLYEIFFLSHTTTNEPIIIAGSIPTGYNFSRKNLVIKQTLTNNNILVCIYGFYINTDAFLCINFLIFLIFNFTLYFHLEFH